MNEWLNLSTTQIQILIRIGIAVVLGASLGLERELADKPAGLRTHMLVSGAAASLVSLSEILVRNFGQQFNIEGLNSDPIRIIDAVITGVSLLGAGTIIRSRSDGQVEGLTTAASILFAATIGVAVAVNEIGLAFVATAMALVTLHILRWVEGWLNRKSVTKLIEMLRRRYSDRINLVTQSTRRFQALDNSNNTNFGGI